MSQLAQIYSSYFANVGNCVTALKDSYVSLIGVILNQGK